VNSGFINRLVGTSIVVIAAIVFIPNILDGEKLHYKEGFKAIPERSEFKTIDLQESIDAKVAEAEPLKAQAIENIQADDKVLTDEPSNAPEPKMVAATVTAKPVKPPVKVKVAPQKVDEIKPRSSDDNLTSMAYVIQLGSFSHIENVKALQAKLTSKGFKNFTKPIKTPNGELTKVFVGPSLNKTELDKKLPALKKLTKLTGKVTRYEITK